MTIRLRDLSQGALLHVLVALLAGPMKADQIARKTGKSPESVQRALATLASEFDLVTAVPDGRWPIWSLRDTSQLQLDLTLSLDSPDVDNPVDLVENSDGLTPQISESDRSSGSLKKDSGDSYLLPLPLTPQITESPTCLLLISQLTRLGATPDQAAKAITAALKRRETTAAISQRIARLAQYAAEHRTIQSPGQWALKYIDTGCDLPVDLHAGGPDYSGYRPYLATGSADDDEAADEG